MVCRVSPSGSRGLPSTNENSGTMPNCRMRAASSSVCSVVNCLFISREHSVGARLRAEEDHRAAGRRAGRAASRRNSAAAMSMRPSHHQCRRSGAMRIGQLGRVRSRAERSCCRRTARHRSPNCALQMTLSTAAVRSGVSHLLRGPGTSARRRRNCSGTGSRCSPDGPPCACPERSARCTARRPQPVIGQPRKIVRASGSGRSGLCTVEAERVLEGKAADVARELRCRAARRSSSGSVSSPWPRTTKST